MWTWHCEVQRVTSDAVGWNNSNRKSGTSV